MLTRKEKKILKQLAAKYAATNTQTQQEYRILNGCVVSQGNRSYTSANGITITSGNSIELDTTTTSTPEIARLLIDDGLTVDDGTVNFKSADVVDIGDVGICDTPTSTSGANAIANKEYVDALGTTVSSTGTSTTALPTYITIGGTEYKNDALPSTKSTYQTTEPTSAITDGGVHIVYLTTEPTTYYDGYIYMIKE